MKCFVSYKDMAHLQEGHGCDNDLTLYLKSDMVFPLVKPFVAS